MGWISFRGISTESMVGVEVSQMPNHKKAGKRMTEYYIKGRDGALHVNEGYSNIELTAVLVLIDGNSELRQTVNAWADGTGKLVTSDDPDKAYIATVRDEIRWTRILGNSGFYDTAEINFNCQPFMYEAVETVAELTQPTAGEDWTHTIINPGTMIALPMMEVTGSGNVMIDIQSPNFGGSVTDLYNLGQYPANIDSENGYAYTLMGGAVSMSGNFPFFATGENLITFSSGITAVKIIPRWRWL